MLQQHSLCEKIGHFLEKFSLAFHFKRYNSLLNYDPPPPKLPVL
ncbi:hypothetical protein FORC066_3944 [Yersinia enterocolitica]|nr:hypothetical protein FORC066_3944 [Yersinia enterocolitica]